MSLRSSAHPNASLSERLAEVDVAVLVGRAERTVAVLGLDALMEQIEVDPPRLDRDAEKELALAEEILAARHRAVDHAEPDAQVAEEEPRGDLERFARRDQRIDAAVTLVHEGPRRAGDLGVLLLHQPVAPVVVRAELSATENSRFAQEEPLTP